MFLSLLLCFLSLVAVKSALRSNLNGETELQVASLNGDLVHVEALIEEALKNSKLVELVEEQHPITKWTALFYAASSKSPNAGKVASILIDTGSAKYEIRDANGMHPIHVAIINRRFDVANQLLRFDSSLASSPCCFHAKKTISHLAAEYNIDNLLKDEYLRYHFDASTLDGYGQNVACWAAINGSREFASQMAEFGGVQLNSGRCLYGKDGTSSTGNPLNVAAYYRQKSYVQLLLDRLNDTDKMVDEKGSGSPLHAMALNSPFLDVDKEIAVMLLNKKKDLQESLDAQGRTPVHLAVQVNNLNALGFFLNRNESSSAFSIRDKAGLTPLLLAVKLGRVDCAKKIIANKKHFSFETLTSAAQTLLRTGDTAIHLAVKLNQREIVRAFVGRGLVIDNRNARGRTVVHLLAMRCTSKSVDIAKLLPDAYFERTQNMSDFFGETPLEIAVKRDCVEMVELFLSKGMRCTGKNQQGYTPLHLAKLLGFDSLVDSMIGSGNCSLAQEDACGVKVEEMNDTIPLQDRCENVPLIEHAMFSVSDAEKLPSMMCIGTKLDFTCKPGYLLRGANTVVCNSAGKWQISGYCDPYCDKYVPMLGEAYSNNGTTSDRIGSRRDIACISGFQKIGWQSEPAICGSDGRWQVAPYCKGNVEALQVQLRESAKSGDVDKVRQLLQLGILDINAKDNLGWTALIWAANNGRLETVELLLDRNANIEAKTGHGYTSLINAAANGQLEIVRLLLDRNANINAENSNGETALMFPAWYGQLETVRLLLDRHADINTKNNNGYTALIYAAEIGRLEIVRLLLDRNADIEAKSSNGYTALIYAAENGRLEIVRLLLDRKADIDAKTDDGWTAVMIAASHGQADVVRLLKSRGASMKGCTSSFSPNCNL